MTSKIVPVLPRLTQLPIVDSDGNMYREWQNWFRNANDRMLNPYKFHVAEAMTINAGTNIGSSVVADVQTFADGNWAQIEEVAATPGFDIEFGFTGVKKFHGIYVRISYEGSSSHYATVELYNYTRSIYDTLWERLGTVSDWQSIHIPIPISSDNYTSDGVVTIKINHPANGNAAHNVYIDYIALVY